MLRNVPTLWLNVLSGIGVFLCAGALFQGYQTNRRAHYERQRQLGMRQVVANAQPVIAAIRAYEKQHKKPPETLEILKKTFPKPGPMAERSWEYHIEEKEKLWTLEVSVNPEYTPNNGFLTFGDTFVYRSDGQYEREAYGGILERFGEWGYYWE
jgi:hypothetical protein